MSPRKSVRERRVAAAAAAKERRKKVLAIGGLCVLAVLLFIQGPRMLDLVSGSSPAPAAVPAQPGPETTPAEPPAPLRTAGVDPFAARRLADNDPDAGPVPAPAGQRDPFVQAAGAGPAAPTGSPSEEKPAAGPAPLPKQIVVGTPRANVKARRGWIVVLASIPTRNGRSSADRFARQVRANGLSSIAVLESTGQRPLRAGYYVVYNGPYETLQAVQRAADHVHAFGYRTAYVREILRY